MRIGFNAQLLVNPTRSGIEHYIYYLLESLAIIDKDNEYIIFCKSENDLPPIALKKDNFILCNSLLPLSIRGFRVLREQLFFPFHLSQKNIDIYHGTHFMLPVILYCPSVVTFHDLLLRRGLDLDTYETSNPLSKLFLNFILPYSARKAQKIISVSDSTKSDIVNELKIKPDKVVTVYHGVSKSFRRIDDRNHLEKVRSIFNLPTEYFLFVGALKPRRNLLRVIEAYSLLKKYHGVNHKFVIAGPKDERYKEVFVNIEKLGLTDDTIFIGNIDHKVLPAIYNMASFFIYPSLYDGFGFPPVEAMACGVPVITSNVSSLPEIVSDAGILVDPYNIEEMATAMWRVISDKELSEKMAKKGMERAAGFTWERCARDTLRVYNDVYHGI